MTIMLDLSPELEAKVQQNARCKGLPLEEYVLHTLEDQPAIQHGLQSTLLPEEWIGVFHEWIDSQPQNLPVLTDEEMSRESIYGDNR